MAAATGAGAPATGPRTAAPATSEAGERDPTADTAAAEPDGAAPTAAAAGVVLRPGGLRELLRGDRPLPGDRALPGVPDGRGPPLDRLERGHQRRQPGLRPLPVHPAHPGPVVAGVVRGTTDPAGAEPAG